jgi:hypothetical protein
MSDGENEIPFKEPLPKAQDEASREESGEEEGSGDEEEDEEEDEEVSVNTRRVDWPDLANSI